MVSALVSWARHFTLTVPLSTQKYKWVPANCWENLTNCWGVTCDGLASRPGRVEILLASSCYGNRDKLPRDEPVGSKKASSENKQGRRLRGAEGPGVPVTPPFVSLF